MTTPLVDEWIAYCLGGSKATDPRLSASEKVDDLLRRDPEAGWTLTLELIMAAPDDKVLANVAAGPLEDLLKRDPEAARRRIDRGCRPDSDRDYEERWLTR